MTGMSELKLGVQQVPMVTATLIESQPLFSMQATKAEQMAASAGNKLGAIAVDIAGKANGI